MSSGSQPPRGRDPDVSLHPGAPGELHPRPERLVPTVRLVSLQQERLGWGLGIQAAEATRMGWRESLFGYKSPQNVMA